MRALIAAVLLSFAPAAVAAESTNVSGTIAKFECGDNCWLTVKWGKGHELQLLCRARACEPWVDKAAMPRAMIGRKVVVTLGVAPAVDGNGDIQDYALAATDMKFR